MTFKGSYGPRQLAILTTALDRFCRIGGIEKNTPEYDEAGRLILSLFRRGATTAEALATALENQLQGEDPRRSSEWLRDR